MRVRCKTILILVAVVFLLGATTCLAEKGRGDGKGRRMKLTDEKIEWMMDRLQEKNPEKAEELQRLREKNPEEFRNELRKIHHRQSGKRRHGKKSRGRGDKMRPPMQGRPDAPCIEPGMRAEPGRGPRGRDKMGRGGKYLREKHQEYIEWLKENYPEKAEKMAALKKEKPELYRRKLKLGWKKHRRIMQEDNPKVAEILKKDLTLKMKRDKLLGKIRSAVKGKEKKQLTSQLEETVEQRFDLIIERKRLRYEQLSGKLEKLKAEVKQRETELQKDIDRKDAEVKERVKKLLEKGEQFGWE